MFSACADCLRRGVPLDFFTVLAATAPSRNVEAAGGRAWLTTLLMGSEPFAASLDEHARKATAALLGDPACKPAEVLQDGSRAFSELTIATASLGTAEGDVMQFAEARDAAQTSRREPVTLTGLEPLDREIGGLQPGVLTMIGALPAVGKSSLLVTMLKNIARRGTRVGLFSLEDSRLWVTERLVALYARVPLFLLKWRVLSPEQLERVHEAQPQVYDLMRNVVIDDRQDLTAADVVQAARTMILELGCGVILVDHIGEIRTQRSERYDLDIADALAALRDVAKRHSVPVVVASHVKRRNGVDEKTAPSLTDFANSSAPERMARVALGLSRPADGCLRVTVLKQTNGSAGQNIDLDLAGPAGMVSSGGGQ